jgi:Sec-independent protein translocase protein TatA
MTISMEQIDELRKRTNCSYEEAKILLEKHNGDLLEAIVEFERKNRSSSNNKSHNGTVSLGARIKQLINKGFKTRFIIEKSGETIINISVNLLILAAIILHWFLLIALVISLIFGCRFKIRKEKGESIDLNKIINGFGSKVREATVESREHNKQNDTKKYENKSNDGNDDNNDNDGYNEITVE